MAEEKSGGGGGLGAIVGIAQTGLGLYQTIRADKMRKKAQKKFDENPYQIPESAVRAVNRTGSLSQGTRMAGQDLIEENIGANTAQGIANARRTASSPSQILASTVALYGQQQEQQKELDLVAQQDWQRRQQNFTNAISTLAPYETEKWKYSSLYPYQSAMNASSQMSQTGTQNISSGVNSVVSSYANADYLEKLAPMMAGG